MTEKWSQKIGGRDMATETWGQSIGHNNGAIQDVKRSIEEGEAWMMRNKRKTRRERNGKNYSCNKSNQTKNHG